MDEKGLGKRLQEARRHAGLTQQDLCQRAELSYSTLAKIERGAIKSPSIFTIQRIATALGVSLDVLLGHETKPPATSKKTSKRGVKFVYFDVNGCVVQYTHHGFTRLSELSGVPVDEIQNVFWEYDEATNKGEATMEQLNGALSERLQMEVDWLEYYLDAVETNPGMAELLEWVSQYYHVGLLTNTMPGFVEALQARGKIPPVMFDYIIDSSQVGSIKPEPEIYDIAQAKTGVEAADILFVDDLRSNLIAAKRKGWHTIWFDSYRPDESIATVRAALEFDT